ncbi:Uncharacterised protein g2172 [Pycnogonum litorale]
MAVNVDYSQLKEMICARLKNVAHIKKNYANDVNSNRWLNKISSVEDLVKVLEKRNIVSENNVSVLKEMVRIAKEDNLLIYLDSHERKKSLRSDSRCTFCFEINLAKTFSQINNSSTGPRNQGSTELMSNRVDPRDIEFRKVVDYLKGRIVSKWKDFGRSLYGSVELTIIEGHLDRIDKDNRHYPDKIVALIEGWKKELRDRATIEKIRKALKNSGHKYLHDDISNGRHLNE